LEEDMDVISHIAKDAAISLSLSTTSAKILIIKKKDCSSTQSSFKEEATVLKSVAVYSMI
jgi:hypothetical protein